MTPGRPGGGTAPGSALGDADATALPALLAAVRRHLDRHPNLAGRIDQVAADTVEVRRRTSEERDG
ncbi:hypothetical protein [Dactylosporangium sp. NPDC049140]|uniref:hypothetical protein n=1 Tax=Dactylosporangium sp. NPDC049140 TaxID=3155647 RepID=UPI0033FAF20A